MTSLLRFFGYTRSIPLHDHTDSRRSLRSIAHQKSGDPLGDPAFVTHVDRVTDADERARKTERIFAARRAWSGAAALLALFLASPASPAETTRQLSAGQPWSEVYLPSLPQVSPDSQRVVYAHDAATNGAHELWSVGMFAGAPIRLSNALASGQSVKFQIAPDSQRVVYQTDQTTRGIPDLYSAPIAGGASVKLSMDLAALPGQVRDFLASPDSQRAYYAADGAVNNLIELWRVDLAGGPSTRLNAPISGNYDVFEYAVSPADRIVYRVGRATVGGHELWTVPGDGRASQARRISLPLVAGGGVRSRFALTPDGQRAVYSADALDNGRFDLWSVPIVGGTSTRLDRDDGRSVKSDFIVDAHGVTYNYGPTEHYRAPVTGGASLPVPPPIPPAVRSPDGQWIVYSVGSALWSSGPSGRHHRVSCRDQVTIPTFLAQPAYSITPDSRSVVFIASGNVWASPLTGAVCLLFRDGFETGNAEAWS